MVKASSETSPSSCELITPTSPDSWAAYHDIRRRVLFERRGRFCVYDPNRPDETNPQNYPKVLVSGSTSIGVVRIDCESDIAYFRRVAIDEPYQRQGFGRVLIGLAEDFAHRKGATRIESAVAPDAVAFYEKCGYQRLADSSGSSVPMYKSLAAREMTLVWPSREYLPSYVAALERGWSPDNMRGQAATHEQLQRIAEDADAFLARLVDKEAKGTPITLPDGTTVPRLPGYQRWMWDGEFCGSIGFRWQPGTEALPPHCLGHIGYSVVPWKQRLGYATRALRETLRDARAQGLRYAEVTTSPDNAASRRVIEANGGTLIEEFITPAALGGRPELRYRVFFDENSERS